MCGIAGYSGKGNSAVLRTMNDSLAHRGPDDAGTRIFEGIEGRGSVGLAQRRLSIIDLSPAGHQPMPDEHEHVWVVFNGEIYNFEQLRKELKGKHLFKGKSDTEVIVHLYQEVGEVVFEKLEGMFAIALYDTKKQKLFLARDRMGKKPLYWSVQDGTLFFGSELKALMAHPDFTREIDVRSLNKYLQYEYVPTPHTILKDTWKLEPGTYLVWDGRVAKKKQFWKPTFLPKHTSFKDSLEALDGAIAVALSDRLVSDVPLGVFLSGGLDSSTVAYYAQKAGRGAVKTFSIGFRERSFDESGFAREVAEFLGTEHHEEILSVNAGMDMLKEIGESLDEPMADASIVPTYLLSRFTREHVTVALGGDGGDELFFGYDTFLAHRFARLYGYVPKALRSLVRNGAHLVPTSHTNMSADFKLKKFVDGFEGELKYRNQRWLGAFNEEERQALLSDTAGREVQKENVFEDIDRYLGEVDSHEPYDELAYVYERMYMMDQVLVKVDRASMMHSLEVRAPFLDTRVVDIANHMPVGYKFRGLERKYALKKLMEGRLPKHIIHRKKKGFGMPIGTWMREGLRPFVEECLGEDSLKEIGLFNSRYVKNLVDEHMSGWRDNRKQLWTLLVFVLWYRRWMEKK